MSITSTNPAVCMEIQPELKNLCIKLSTGCTSAETYIVIINTTFMVCTFTLGSVYLLQGVTRTVKLIYNISYKCLYPRKLKTLEEPPKEPKTGGKLWKNFLKSAEKISQAAIPLVVGVILYKVNELIADGMCSTVASECTSLTAKLVTICDSIDTAIVTTVNRTVQAYFPG